MRVQDVTPPDPEAGDLRSGLLIRTATPEIGRQWTDTGELYEERDLKGRTEGDTRTVPGASRVEAHLAAARAWRGARRAVPLPPVFGLPTGKRVYGSRHTRLTRWLNDGFPPAQAAEWAGNGVPVLLVTPSRCADGQFPDLKKRREAPADLPELPGAG